MSSVVFPFKCSDMASALSLVERTSGAYALGASSFWHGGIHLGLSRDTEAIIAPIDGNIVAYRTMKKRTTGKFSIAINDKGEQIPQGKNEDFDSSFGFVLTHHEFETPEEEKIEFYLLHMHLLCYEHYTDVHKANPPPYLHGRAQFFVKTKEDKGGSLAGRGIHLRAAATSKENNVICVLEEGSEFKFKPPRKYDHTNPKDYHEIQVLNPISYNVSNACVKTGIDRTGELRLTPVGHYFDKYEVLFAARIDTPSHGHMGIPLYINGKHVGDLLEEQKIYFLSRPNYHGAHNIILDNIAEVIALDAEGSLSWKSLRDGVSDGGTYFEPTRHDIISLEDAVCDLDIDLTDKNVRATVDVCFEGGDSGHGKITLIEEKFSVFEVNTFESNHCGVAAYERCSTKKLVTIPFATVVYLESPISMDQLLEEQAVDIKPITLKPRDTGFIHCGKGKIEQILHEVTGNFDSIEVLDPPIEVGKGEVIGYPGAHEKQNSVHMELWLKNPAFLDNPKADKKFENHADIPVGLASKIKTVEKKFGEEVTLFIPAKTRLKLQRTTQAEKGEAGNLRKVKFSGKIYYAKRTDLGGYNTVSKCYIPSHKTGVTVDFYDGHPEIEQEVVVYKDSTLPSAITLDEIPNTTAIDERNYFPIECKTQADDGSSTIETHFIEESLFNEYRVNLYDWKRFFTCLQASDLGFRANGSYESKADIEESVEKAYKNAVDSAEMEPMPSDHSSHPLSHLIIETGTEWSKSYKTESKWADGAIDQMWKEQKVSSVEEEQGLTKESLKKIFDPTIQLYSDQISFFDELVGKIEGLPEKNALCHAHPIRFLGHLEKIAGSPGPYWMAISTEEAIKYKGLKEQIEPLASAVKDNYHDYVGRVVSSKNPWCASFVSWCLGQAQFGNPMSRGSQSFIRHATLKKVEAQYGAVAVFTDCTASGEILRDEDGAAHGHVTFVYGKINDRDYLCLGGNQGNMIKISKYDCSGEVFVSYRDKNKVSHYKKWRGFYVPLEYKEPRNKALPMYSSPKEANAQLLNIKIKESVMGESSK